MSYHRVGYKPHVLEMRSKNDALRPWLRRAFGPRTTKTWTPSRSLRNPVAVRVSPEAQPDIAENCSFAAPLTWKCRASSPQTESPVPEKRNNNTINMIEFC